MTLKLKSLLISLSTAAFFILAIVSVIFGVVTVQFQKIEDQRVERNIRRITAILNDRYNQLNTKLSDWTIWDDTYQFIQDKNEEYIKSNLTVESFINLGVDETLFINNKGALVKSVSSDTSDNVSDQNTQEVYQHFATGSALAKIDSKTGFNFGTIKTNKGILLFVIRNVVKSDNTGTPSGTMLFGRYLDENILNSVKDLTQFEASIHLWDDPNIPADYQIAKQKYSSGTKSSIKTLDNNIISGYLTIEDVYGKPQAIIRSDIYRDITIQGKSSMTFLIYLLICVGTLVSAINYFLITGMVLKKVSLIATDVDSIAKSGTNTVRLSINKTTDEVDKLRVEINLMLDQLTAEKKKGESLIDLVNAIIINLNNKGEVIMINKKGLEIIGFQKEEVIGKNWIESFIPQSYQHTVSNKFKELISGKLLGNSEIENEILTKDNRNILISWHNTLIKDDEGKVVSTLSLGEDITIEKQEQKKKEQYAKELERLNELMVNRELKMVALKKELDKINKA